MPGIKMMLVGEFSLNVTTIFKLRLAILSLLFLIFTPVEASESDLSSLLNMDMKQLMDVEVTTVDKWAQPLDDVAAAITVLSHEDMMRSGMQTVPELMRMVPGIQVGRISAS
ncbi:MAG: hypothetical protein Q9M31_02085, partial [Mariprofundus sp.]|nr:hypothetical protein [Mariprofundus sp.]